MPRRAHIKLTAPSVQFIVHHKRWGRSHGDNSSLGLDQKINRKVTDYNESNRTGNVEWNYLVKQKSQ